MSIDPIQALAAIGAQVPVDPAGAAPAVSGRAPSSFARMMLDGVQNTNQKILDAERMQTMATLDDSVPPHRVFVAGAQAHDALLLMMQVRARLVEGYQEIMRMQL
jgi:flagellar hook-basal body complex protein FliE